jgi:hypothetical protein
MHSNSFPQRFLEYTEEHFSFLENVFGYFCLRSEIVNPRYAVMIYQSNQVVLSISFNSYSFEISMEINQNIENARKFSFSDLVRFYNAESSIGFLAPQASTEERLDKTLSIMSNFLRQNATEFINGDSLAFAKLLDFIKQPIKRKLP